MKRGRQDRDEAGDSVALQKCCCLNMAPADLQYEQLSSLPPLLLSSLSFFSSSISCSCLFPSVFLPIPSVSLSLFALHCFSFYHGAVSLPRLLS